MATHPVIAAAPTGGQLDRGALLARYLRNRERSRLLFDVLTDEAYYARPIAQRHPVVFYEGHLPGFSFNTLVKRGLGGPSIDPALEALFARGIDPHESPAAGDDPGKLARQWPSRAVVRQFAAEADRRVIEALTNGNIWQPRHPLLDRAEAAWGILEHEEMHHETLLYMWHRVPYDQKRAPADAAPVLGAAAPRQSWVTIPAGEATLGATRASEPFTWDNEREPLTVYVPAFRIQRHDVTNAAFMEFVAAGGYHDARWWSPADWAWRVETQLEHPRFWRYDDDGQWRWRGMFDEVPLPPSWPVYVSHAEAMAYTRWSGTRLPTEAEYHRAAFGTPSGEPRRHPWGAAAPAARHGVFDLASWDPQPAGSHPEGDSAFFVADLAGNGWEWTSSAFAPFPGFLPMPTYPEYSADFFDGEHFVLKGASPATAAELVRPSFRNWFRPRYPYVYATFRCVAMGAAR